jgi:hypothetical protein
VDEFQDVTPDKSGHRRKKTNDENELSPPSNTYSKKAKKSVGNKTIEAKNQQVAELMKYILEFEAMKISKKQKVF